MTLVSSANAYGEIAQRKLFMFLRFQRTQAQKLTQPWQLKTKRMLKFFFYGIGPARGGGTGVTRHPKRKKGRLAAAAAANNRSLLFGARAYNARTFTCFKVSLQGGSRLWPSTSLPNRN